ncbi:hypothetical protein KC19_12G098400 [Ceratodon purpureus]|uniref:AB hydrolase-1 domain-containing protein n=1 Tax=Ceratodon purpureus TaxID=3225 RepID=A0A8T0G5I7_CERPU|nr:hypothetical protein KC19_12G098400 [Ceratodon purpureus]
MELPLGFSPTHIFNFFVGKYLGFCGLQCRLVELDNGTTMECWMPKKYGTRQTRGYSSTDKPSLVLLHAFGLNSYTWCRQVSSFSSAFDVFIPNLLFSGRSHTTNKERTEYFQAECVFKLLQQLNVLEFSVVGTSYGGFVAYRMAHMYPHAVQKLVISSSAVNMTPATDEAMVKRFKTKNVTEILQPHDIEGVRRASILAFHKQPPFTVPEFILNDVLNVLFNVNREEKLELIAGLQLRKPDAPPLPKVTQEVLLIWGEHDPVFDISYAHRLKEDLGDRADLVILKNAAHVPQAEVPKEYNKKVLEFLTRPPRGE